MTVSFYSLNSLCSIQLIYKIHMYKCTQADSVTLLTSELKRIWQTLQEMTGRLAFINGTPKVWLIAAFCTGSIWKGRRGIPTISQTAMGCYQKGTSSHPNAQWVFSSLSNVCLEQLHLSSHCTAVGLIFSMQKMFIFLWWYGLWYNVIWKHCTSPDKWDAK